jgi:sarcosine oxidase
MPAPSIAVIGLGAAGSAALYQLSRRGARAIGFEQFPLGHDRGSSHGPTRIIRLAHYENAAYVPLMRRAYELWRELESVINQRLITTTGIIQIGAANARIVKDTLAAAGKYDLQPEVLNAGSVMRRYPAFRLPGHFAAVWQPDGGFLEAAAALDATLRIAVESGAQIRAPEKVVAIEPRPQGVRIRTDRTEIDADGAIVAGGPWMSELVPDLKLRLRVTRQVVGWFEPMERAQFTADRFPVFILETEYGHHYGLPAYGGMGLKIAKHHHLEEAVAPDACDRAVTAKDEAAIRAPLATYLPGADGRLVKAETCLYTMTPDSTFIIDAVPGYEHIVIASPCCGHGFKFSPVVGEILADLAILGTTEHDIAQFRLQRFA